MIVAEIYKDKSGKMSGFSISGHANTAPHGYDIYCAGVSTLTQSALLCIKKAPQAVLLRGGLPPGELG